jgi:hypothetical protein
MPQPGGRAVAHITGTAWSAKCYMNMRPLYRSISRRSCKPANPSRRLIKGAKDFGNYSTHSAGALYQAFPASESQPVLRRMEFHYVPKHASWFNMIEIEIRVLRGQCLDRRNATQGATRIRDRSLGTTAQCFGVRIKWMFITEKARAKMGRAYQEPPAVRGTQTKESFTVQRYRPEIA